MNKPTHDTSWIGVDFDRTLATYETWGDAQLGKPIKLMVERVKRWLAEGIEVRVFTARVASTVSNREWHRRAIEEWCVEHIGTKLKVTAEKDFYMCEFWDDRAVRVQANEGYAESTSEFDPLTSSEELRMWKQRDNEDA